jgi:hypothetical protein
MSSRWWVCDPVYVRVTPHQVSTDAAAAAAASAEDEIAQLRIELASRCARVRCDACVDVAACAHTVKTSSALRGGSWNKACVVYVILP